MVKAMQLYKNHMNDIFVPEEYIVQYFISRQEEQYNGERETKEKAFFTIFCLYWSNVLLDRQTIYLNRRAQALIVQF